MPNFVLKRIRGARSRIKSGFRDPRTIALCNAAVRRLGTEDYERISIAEIARLAGCSVGAFYGRFTSKKSFLDLVTASAFLKLTDRADHDLGILQRSGASPPEILKGIVQHIITQMSDGEMAGAIRATLKLAMINPDVIEPFHRYREAVADRAVTLLAPKSSADTAGSVRTTIHMIFGIVTDAITYGRGPLQLGSQHMVDTLDAVMTNYVNFESKEHRLKGIEERLKSDSQSP